ncbi:unannotated protein [freshwater metagenome]|uniref:Unannotated protein n=1 Tax=freshwater metagenome TaxID=449393 RepID=A0A6J6DSL8_9ZZZZ
MLHVTLLRERRVMDQDRKVHGQQRIRSRFGFRRHRQPWHRWRHNNLFRFQRFECPCSSLLPLQKLSRHIPPIRFRKFANLQPSQHVQAQSPTQSCLMSQTTPLHHDADRVQELLRHRVQQGRRTRRTWQSSRCREHRREFPRSRTHQDFPRTQTLDDHRQQPESLRPATGRKTTTRHHR